jgi:hypothetical protein
MHAARMRKLLNRVFFVLCVTKSVCEPTLRRLLYFFVLFMKLVKNGGNGSFLLFESVNHSERDSLSCNKRQHVYELYAAILTL